MEPTRRNWSWKLLLAAAALAVLPGCFNTQNPSYFPYLLPAGDIVRTHAKPPGHGYFADFDPHAVRLEVRPLESTHPVRAHKVLLATIYDDKGEPRRKRRVEWMVEGVGNIVEVDESGYLSGRGYKVDNKYAVSYTDYQEHRITRGNADPNDDFMVRPGQSWCVISSAVEGDTQVTVYAPEINDWDHNKVVVTTHWVDAEWALPTPAVVRAGFERSLVTAVFRHTDHQPLANYRVRYRILDGPPAVLLPYRSQEAVAVSDLRGNAPVAIAQAVPQPGVNRVAVEIIRPPDPTLPSGTGIVIGHGETTVSWQAPAVSLNTQGPAAAGIGQEVAYTIAVTNSGQVESQAMTLREVIPEGVEYVRSQPAAILEGNQLVWTLGVLPGGQAHTVQVVFRSTRLGTVTHRPQVATAEGQQDEKSVTTQITAPQLTVGLTGPATGVVNAPVAYQITVTNPGTAPAANVLLSAAFDAGLEHNSHANPVELPVGTLGPGENKTVALSLTPREAGRLVNRVSATADGNLRAAAEHAVTAQRAQLTLTNSGPTARFVDQAATWDLRVANEGDAVLTNVVVHDRLPPEMVFTSATEGGQVVGGDVAWNLGNLAPREQKALQLTAQCQRMASRTANVATATAEPGVRVQAEAPLEIRGLPAFALELLDVGDPAQVGGRVTYRITVTNTGSLPANQVAITAEVPPQMRVIGTNGPTQPRLDGQRLVFPAVDAVQPRQTLNYTIDVQAVEAGDVRFRVELRGETLREPVIKEESTNIYAPPTAGLTRPTAPPARGPAAPGLPAESPPPPLAPTR